MTSAFRDSLRDFLPTVYERYGPLVARQYAYRAEAAGLVVKTKKNFDAVNEVLVEIRENDGLPYSAVLDASRTCEPKATEGQTPDRFVALWQSVFRYRLKGYSIPKWDGQRIVPVILSEKEGLVPYFEAITDDLEVSVYPIKGQAGKSHLHEEFVPWARGILREHGEVRLFYLGDLDDYGFQIEESLNETLAGWGLPLKTERLALLPEQAEQYGIRLEPIESKDHTLNGKYRLPGKAEIEALEPSILRDLVRRAIESCFDSASEEDRRGRQETAKARVQELGEELMAGWEE